jgi:hypothetical protein
LVRLRSDFGFEAGMKARRVDLDFLGKKWSERGDLNSRPPVPQSGMLCFSDLSPDHGVPHRLYMCGVPNSAGGKSRVISVAISVAIGPYAP